jgi:polysaccharide pyruvyl transferase WcaK-like protein
LANAGDASISVGVDRVLRSIAPTAAVLHAAYQHEEVGPLIPELRFVPSLEGLLGTPGAPAARGWETVGRELVEQADLVICQAAGAFVESYSPGARLVSLDAVVDMGTPLVVLGASIGPFSGTEARYHFRRILSHASLVTVRDPQSMFTAADLGAPDPVFGSDLALALFARPEASSTRRGIGVVLTAHHPVAEQQSQVAEAARTMLDEVLTRRGDEPVHVWSTVQGMPEAAREDDAEIASLLKPLSTQSLTTEAGYVPPARAIELVSGARVLLSMRLHPSLFAASSGVPFGLALDGQRVGVFEGSGLGDRIVNPFDHAAVRRLVASTLDDDTDPRLLWDRMAPLRQRLETSIELLEHVVEDVSGAPTRRIRMVR